ncbi:RNA polymerase sigma factor [Colwelliaceae bacterium BS250]|jgi:RNA polymerase sigma-70 factor (ECF subfamily)
MLSKLISKFTEQNDPHVFTEIVKACQSDLRGYCRRLTAGDHALADDIAQESLITAYQQLGKLNNVKAFKSWLYRIAYRNFINQIAKNKEQLQETLPEIAITDNSENEQLIMQLMQYLSEEQRAVVTLNMTLGYGHDEVASILNMPLGTVKSHCKRGKDKLLSIGQQLQLGAA